MAGAETLRAVGAPEPPVRSGVEVGPRRADRFCCPMIIAGPASAITRSKIPGTKNLFLTKPS